MQAFLVNHGVSRVCVADDRHHKLFVGQEDEKEQKHAGDEVHGGTGHQNDQPLPPGRLAEGPAVLRVSVLTLHGAEAAKGDAPEGVGGLPHLLLENRRPHEQGKFIYPDTGQLRRHKMSQLVNED